MKKVDQTMTGLDRGDCMRAVVASLFELEIVQVPHFLLFGDNWWAVFCYFIQSIGYEVMGTGYSGERKPAQEDSVDGFISACVPSKTFGGDVTHNVIINLEGLVVHDPQPLKRWEGINVIETGELKSWDLIKKKEN